MAASGDIAGADPEHAVSREIDMALAFALPQVIRNEILASLSVQDFAELRPHLTRVRLVSGQVLIEPGQLTEHVYFVEEGMVSLVAECGTSRAAAQVAMIGREGMVGCFALLAQGAVSSTSAISQIPGPAVRIPAAELIAFAAARPPVRDLCLAYALNLMQQTMQTAASNVQNTLPERCIRWLLMAHDRIDGDDLLITHEALSTMLGVRRSGVTVVASGLQEAGLIKAGRGRITITDRAGLERAAGSRGCYVAWEAADRSAPSLNGTNRSNGADQAPASLSVGARD
jgi:CRP-like cAMP-binding protein